MVYKGQNTLTQEIVAIKCVSLDSSLNTVAEVQREIEFFAKLHHPQIANYITSFVYESSELWIVLELVEGGSALEMVGLIHLIGASQCLPLHSRRSNGRISVKNTLP